MKVLILLLLLLTPINANANQNIKLILDCSQNEYKINESANCKLNIENPNKVFIKDIYFKTNNNLEEPLISEGNTLIKTENGYQISLKEEEFNFLELMSFIFKIDQPNYELSLNDIEIILNDNSIIDYTPNIKKKFAIKENEYLSSININGQEFSNFENDKYDYEYDIFTNSQFIEVKALSYEGFKVLDNYTLFNINDEVINIKVANETGETKEYTIKLNVLQDNGELLKNVNITEIDFEFNPYKFSYYFQIPYEINALSFNYEINSLDNSYEMDHADLAVGDNIIELKNKNSNIIYKFYIERLEKNIAVDDNLELKYLRIGKTYINLKNDVLAYNISKIENPIVELKTTIDNQDYDAIYTDSQIKINIYSLSGKMKTYIINLEDDDDVLTPDINYDRTTNKIIVGIFTALVILISLIVFKKEKEYRKNF